MTTASAPGRFSMSGRTQGIHPPLNPLRSFSEPARNAAEAIRDAAEGNAKRATFRGNPSL